MNPVILPPNILRRMNPADRKRLGRAGMLPSEIAAKDALKLEKELQKQVASLLRRRGIVANSSRMDKRKTDRVGWPDFTFAVAGMACCVECKVPGQPLSDDQKVLRVELEAWPNGWHYWVIETYDEAMELIDSLLEYSVKKKGN